MTLCSNRNPASGITLIELLAALAVLALATAIVLQAPISRERGGETRTAEKLVDAARLRAVIAGEQVRLSSYAPLCVDASDVTFLPDGGAFGSRSCIIIEGAEVSFALNPFFGHMEIP